MRLKSMECVSALQTETAIAAYENNNQKKVKEVKLICLRMAVCVCLYPFSCYCFSFIPF